MSYCDPSFSPIDFFREGPSLWRWIRYGHGTGTSSYFVNPFSQESLASPCAPHIKRRIEYLMREPQKLPPRFRERGANFARSSANFPVNLRANYPGDGYLFFTDPFIYGYSFPTHTDINTIKFYNFIYSYRNFFTPSLFFFLVNLEDHIEKIKLFYEHRYLIFGNTSNFDEYRTLCNKMNSHRRIEIAFLERIFGHSIFALADEINIPVYRFLSHVYKILEGLTANAAKRILFNRQATRRSIFGSVNLVSDTQHLINHALPQKFDSIAALKTYHDDQMDYIYRKAREKETGLYAWNSKLVSLVNSICEGWYIPVRPTELIERGIAHENCVGSYFERHFEKPRAKDANKETFYKTLILINKEAEAEFHLIFKKKNITKSTSESYEKTVCESSKILQCRTKYNREYPQDIPDRLCSAFIGCDINLFEPVRK